MTAFVIKLLSVFARVGFAVTLYTLCLFALLYPAKFVPELYRFPLSLTLLGLVLLFAVRLLLILGIKVCYALGRRYVGDGRAVARSRALVVLYDLLSVAAFGPAFVLVEYFSPEHLSYAGGSLRVLVIAMVIGFASATATLVVEVVGDAIESFWRASRFAVRNKTL